MRNKVELLAPAGSPEGIRAAVQSGAGAVYMGFGMFNARRNAQGFSHDEMADAIAYCRARDVKTNITLNILAGDRELEDALEDAKFLYEAGAAALIVQDLGLARLIHAHAPDFALHASTQMTIHTLDAAKQARDIGFSRVVLSRECSREEIKLITEQAGVETEVFVHGALCMCYSGQCYLSAVIGQRSGNRGLCAQPCRLPYSGGYPLSLKDLMLAGHVAELSDWGVSSLKIEGRMKTALYVATVARTYRKAIDDYLENPEKYKANMEWYKEEIGKCTYREFTTGFYFGKPTSETQIYDSNTYVKNYIYLGTVEERDARGFAKIEQKNKFSVGETIEIMKPDGRNISALVRGIYTEDGESQESAPHPKQVLYIDLDGEVEQYDILRKKEAE